MLQRVDLPHQVFDRGLLCLDRASHHRGSEDADQKTFASHVSPTISLLRRLNLVGCVCRKATDTTGEPAATVVMVGLGPAIHVFSCRK